MGGLKVICLSSTIILCLILKKVIFTKDLGGKFGLSCLK